MGGQQRRQWQSEKILSEGRPEVHSVLRDVDDAVACKRTGVLLRGLSKVIGGIDHSDRH